MHEPGTADGACIIRVWMEAGDLVLRGRVESVPDGGTLTARGLDELLAAVRNRLERLELRLRQQAEQN